MHETLKLYFIEETQIFTVLILIKCYNPVMANAIVVKISKILIFFFCMLKLSMMTPMKRLRVKNDPNTMKNTKYKYMPTRISRMGCSPTYEMKFIE